MNFVYPFFICFSLIFFSELGDKTQLLVLSFSTKTKTRNILFGVALGTLIIHGIAILFGSQIGSFDNPTFKFYLEIFTYSSFLLFGVIGFLPKETKSQNIINSSFISKLTNVKLNYILITAINIIIGELGDKTFLASLGLGLQYPNDKIALILGSVLGMVASNSIAIFLGKLVGSRFNSNIIEILSNLLFIIFGLLGFFNMFF